MFTRLGDRRREKNLRKGVNRRPSLLHAVDGWRSSWRGTDFVVAIVVYILV